MNQHGANLAVTIVNHPAMAAVEAVVVDTVEAADVIAEIDKCFLQSAQPVELKLKFPLNQIRRNLFIAVTVLRNPETLNCF